MPARPGAFTANFAVETLEKFRTTCKSTGLQYTKVLEELAEVYLETQGLCLEYQKLSDEFDQRCKENQVLREKLREAGIPVEEEDSLARNHKEVLYEKALRQYESEMEEYDGLGPQPKPPEMRVPPQVRMEVMQELYSDKLGALKGALQAESWMEGFEDELNAAEDPQVMIQVLATAVSNELFNHKQCLNLMYEAFEEQLKGKA